jgi:predicted amidohydrolase YtcJ
MSRNSSLAPARLAGGFLLGILLAGCGARDAATTPAAPTALSVAAAPSVAAADLVLRNGAIYTVDSARSWAEAVAIKDGKIVFVGRDAELGERVGSSTQVVDLKGRMVIPGMQDAHIHPISGGIEASACDLNGKRNAEEYVAAIKAYADAHPDEPWILGGGWLMSAFGPGAMPAKELLDAVVPDRPVYLSSTDGHTTWVNSKALEIAGITRATPDPADGRIDRDPKTGEAIGSLQEGAGALVGKHVPAWTLEKRIAGLRYSQHMLNAYGITAVQDAGVREPELEAYAALDATGGLSLKAVVSQWWVRDGGLEQIATMEAQRSKYTRGRVRATAVKIMQDGVMENYTAVMTEPYHVHGSPKGIPMIDPQLLKSAVTALDAKGFQVHFHAIGDGAIRQCLDAVQTARETNGNSGLRHHISHIQMINPVDLPRFRPLGVIANFQPLWGWADEYITKLTTPFIGEERTRWMYPIAAMRATGAMVAFGSDWSVSTANPFIEMEVAVRRADPSIPDGEVFLPEQRIALPEAIAAFTIGSAFVNGIERETGSVETGKAADLVVLDRNLFTIDPRDISETKALLTLLDGKPVHGDPAAL